MFYYADLVRGGPKIFSKLKFSGIKRGVFITDTVTIWATIREDYLKKHY